MEIICSHKSAGNGIYDCNKNFTTLELEEILSHKNITNYNILLNIIYGIMTENVVMLNAFKQLKKS